MSFPMASLSEVLDDARPGFASGDDLDDGVFQIRMNNLTRGGELVLDKRRRVSAAHKQIRRALLAPGDVLFNATNSPDLVGKTAFFAGCDEPVVYSNHFIRLRSRPDVLDGRFLARWLQREFERGFFKANCKQWVNQATFGKDRLDRLQLPLPPIEEQRRIAAVLDAADALRAKRRQALAKLDTLTQAIFIDMFGDPVDNPRGWSVKQLGDVLAKIDSGKSPVCLDRPARADEWGVLKLGAVTYCEFDDSQHKAMREDVAPDQRLEVRQGDLLFARKNTHELVGAAAYVFGTRSHLLLSDLIFRLVIDPSSGVEARFLHQVLVHPHHRRVVQRLAGGSSGSMPNISKARLATVEVPVPPAEQQASFARAVDAIRAERVGLLRSTEALETLFISLQQRAFRGEL